MQRISPTKIKATIFGCGLVLIIVALFWLIITLINSSALLQTNTATTSSSVSSDQTTKTKQITADHKFLGIRSDDTLAVLKATGEEIVINLAHYKWNKPLWSTDGKLVSVLGQSVVKKSIADLYVYDLATDKWIAVTKFATTATSGITGTVWTDATHMAFTQGVDPDNWLHTYDYQNQEVSKKFRAPGILESYSATEKAFLFSKNTGQVSIPNYQFTLTDQDGQVARTFDASNFDANARLISAKWGKNDQVLIFNTIVNSVNKQYIWDWTTDTIKAINFTPSVDAVCYLDGDNYLVRYIDSDDKKLKFTEYDLTLGKTINEWGAIDKSVSAVFWESNSFCDVEDGYVSVISQELNSQNIVWYIISANSPKLLQGATNYSQLVKRN